MMAAPTTDDSVTIRITADHRTEDGFLFWKGETFSPLNDHLDVGAEVKTAGEYVWIPSGVFEVVG